MNTGSLDQFYAAVRAVYRNQPHPATPSPAAVGVLCRETHGRVEIFAVRRALTMAFLGGYWTFPGGGIHADETAEAALAREVAEETGIDIALATVEPCGRFITPEFSPIRFDALFYLVWLSGEQTPDFALSGGELIAGQWVEPAEFLRRFESGQWAVTSPAVCVARVLSAGREGAAERLVHQADEETAEQRLWQLAAGVWLSPLLTPTLPPATHTNCYLFGTERMIAVDPASPHPAEQDALDRVIERLQATGARLAEIWLTHHHLDHVGGAKHLSERWGVPVCAHPATAERLTGVVTVDRHIHDGDVYELGGTPNQHLRAMFTPGHAPGHLCFIEESTGYAAVGDMVAGIGTILIDPAEGDMTQYLDSLAALRQANLRQLLPAHGAPIADPHGKLSQYIDHRLWREQRVIDALEQAGPGQAQALVRVAYADAPQALLPIAERSMLAHLARLVATGRAHRAVDGSWSLIAS